MSRRWNILIHKYGILDGIRMDIAMVGCEPRIIT